MALVERSTVGKMVNVRLILFVVVHGQRSSGLVRWAWRTRFVGACSMWMMDCARWWFFGGDHEWRWLAVVGGF
ncbi:hypothetical protein SESBI_50588 [Sesbania bispinosa]|nr:hypothetical protein SESBI_50588 [Sesbania bispinosa]